ncbi:unnamed protein product [Nippostrongylus brasiliensis]|uniref:40S ribosomal protein S15 n=1 Tax=Nippostrongylus brasiliensis TaxID=27835 RepID=A0A0N4Y859_NIPBR|nr:unnamed protein product [Nippostrongylus brasiliensis]
MAPGSKKKQLEEEEAEELTLDEKHNKTSSTVAKSLNGHIEYVPELAGRKRKRQRQKSDSPHQRSLFMTLKLDDGIVELLETLHRQKLLA